MFSVIFSLGVMCVAISFFIFNPTNDITLVGMIMGLAFCTLFLLKCFFDEEDYVASVLFKSFHKMIGKPKTNIYPSASLENQKKIILFLEGIKNDRKLKIYDIRTTFELRNDGSILCEKEIPFSKYSSYTFPVNMNYIINTLVKFYKAKKTNDAIDEIQNFIELQNKIHRGIEEELKKIEGLGYGR